jgi:hypothetical protein
MLVPAKCVRERFPKEGAKETYNGLSPGSHPSNAKPQYVQVAISSYSGVGVYFHPASTSYANISIKAAAYSLYEIVPA